MPPMGIVGQAEETISVFPSPLDDPRVFFGLVVLLSVLGGAVLVYRYLRRSPGERFARTLEPLDSVAVLMHSNPDPDAMSCAIAARVIAESRGADATIYYPGQIRHHENRAFETVLDVEFERIDRADQIDEEELVLVDHNRPRDFPGSDALDPIAVVDHHPGSGTGTDFTDIRPDTGACASIFSQYFEQLGWTPTDRDTADVADLNGEGLLSSDVVTGLIYGIQSDTKNLTSGCTRADFDAVRYLYPGIDEGKLNRIANPDMDAESLDVKARAITQRDVRSSFAVSDVGEVSNLDAIPQAADELRRLEGINAVVVLGDKDGEIRLSGRSTDDRVHMGKVLGAVVEDIPMAGAGGHARMGGGRILIEHMNGIGPGEGVTREELTDRFFDAMSGEL